MENDGKHHPHDPRLSVCILTCDRDQLLLPLLLELQQQVSAEDEIIVLDTGDSPVTRELLNNPLLQQVHYYPYLMEQFNFATARNQLLRLAANELVAFIDDDALPFPGWVKQIRLQLASLVASGGATVANDELPEWWDPAINWCVGLSPPGTILGEPGFYPDTCNMAARSELWRKNPFQVVERNGRQLYATGREDADWWMQRLLDGSEVGISYRQAVTHQVHPDRLTLPYIRKRARNDGVSSWLRRPSYKAATDIPWDLAHIIAIVAGNTIKNPFNRRARLVDSIWMHRQWGKFLAVWKSPLAERPRHREQVWQLSRALLFQAKIRIAEKAFRARKFFQASRPFPPQNPRHLFVSADCFLGDSILLRRHVKALADTFPRATVLVSCRFPFLFSNLGPNVTALATSEASDIVHRNPSHIDAAIVPYFPFGDISLWRKTLSRVGVTFDCDVGFPGRRDTIMARQTISKNMELHEQENLARLFRLWPLKPATAAPPPVLPSGAKAEADSAISASGVSDCWISVQIGSGHISKSWPMENWIKFFKAFASGVDLPIILVGDAGIYDEAKLIIQQCDLRDTNGKPQLYNLSGGSVGQLLELIRRSAFFVGGCSGPKHAAMAYGIPTFTLYAASEPVRWGAVENHHLHGYINALPQKLSGMELQDLEDSHRMRLLQPDVVADAALHHYCQVMRRG